ncbi:DNA mismatch repair protein MutS [Posidoniimonas polymericola]|uniref:DNA mismatch repair protein MutS n=1 Tax=Posidoniimonas polymericola TaxID=2528002 RepID=A0A5C5YTS2_9BACT|nr:DNA mismatch repair protein MutS [Posidoniimonas polymericola]TWT78156.1 DNA mismatch repair protein MutS [Posidoniimonas polymericola]
MSLSPMMQQYHQAKEAAGDALLLFRMGDFYEMFHQDAKDAAELLGITLTRRDKGDPERGIEPTPMAGFPHHQLDQYLARIVRAGRRAAICDQMEDPKQAKGIVRREVTRIVSPGTLTEDGLLDPKSSNFLAAVVPAGEWIGLAWVDVSTGRFTATALAADRLADQVVRIAPSECLLSSELTEPVDLPERCTRTTRPGWAFGQQVATEALKKLLGVKSLDGFGFDEDNERHALAIRAAGAIVDYLQETQRSQLGHIDRLLPFENESTLQIDAATWRSLEIAHTLRDGRREGALLGVIDRTVTSTGARLLAEWLRGPLTDAPRINARLDAVAELVDHASLTDAVRERLRAVYDIERLVSRVTTGRASPRDLSCVGRTLAGLPTLKAKLSGRSSERLTQIEQRIDLCPELRAKLEAALEEDCPPKAADGGFVRAGYLADLDECRELMTGGKQWIAKYQAEQVEATGIPSMKVGFNKVFGYYLEVTHAQRDKIPDNFIRKQTLKNAERYITPELKEYEEKVLSAEERVKEIELRVFGELCELVVEAGRRLLSTAAALAELDVLAGLADLARSRAYTRPTMVDAPVLDVAEGRHPVLDVMQPEGQFVPNGVSCAARPDDPEALLNADNVVKGETGKAKGEGSDPAPSLLLITGPNMAGKSTYIRQTALITLLAQIGSFVPAKSATIGVADRLFARVGASDELSRGQSTFMVEMTETARILNTATRRSLVVLDEIGRGTSTYDGLSLAWAITECLHNDIGCRALFATHYHELTDLANQLPGVANRSVAVHEHQGDVVFLHQIVEGAADKSYGIHVARLAGVPRGVNQRAEEILALLESQHDNSSELHTLESSPTLSTPTSKPTAAPRAASDNLQLQLFDAYEHPVVDKLRRVEIDGTTPLDALLLLREWKESLGG